jgi:hypothetical protein
MVGCAQGRRAEIVEAVRGGDLATIRKQFALLRQTALQQLLVDSLPRFMRSEQWAAAVAAAGGASPAYDTPSGRRVTFSSTGRPQLEGEEGGEGREGGGGGGGAHRAAARGGGAAEGGGEAGEGAEDVPAYRRQSTMQRLAVIEELGFTGEGGRREVLSADDVRAAAAACGAKRLVFGFSMRVGPSREQREAMERLARAVRAADAVLREGAMEKRGDHHKTWKRRHFVLAAPGGRALAAEGGDLWDFGSDELPVRAEAMTSRAQRSVLAYFVPSPIVGGAGAGAGAGAVATTSPSAVRADEDAAALSASLDLSAASLKGVIPLADVIGVLPALPDAEGDGRRFTWAIRTKTRTFVFAAPANSERRRWLRALAVLTGCKTDRK